MRKRIPTTEAAEITTRLDEWVQPRFGSFGELCRRKRFHRSNADKWAAGQVPGTFFLWKLAQEDELDPYWLLTGRRSPGERPLVDRLREALVHAYTKAERVPATDIEAALPDAKALWRWLGASVRAPLHRALVIHQNYAAVRRRRTGKPQSVYVLGRRGPQLFKEATDVVLERAERAHISQVYDEALALVDAMTQRVTSPSPTKPRRPRSKRSPKKGRKP